MSTGATESTTASELAATLRPSLLRLTRMIRNQRVDTSVTLTHLSALAVLESKGPMSPGELAASEHVQPPSMTKVLARLEERGLSQRAPHPTDGRQIIVSITPAGLALLDEERRSRHAWLATRLARLSPEELRLLHDVQPVLEKLATP